MPRHDRKKSAALTLRTEAEAVGFPIDAALRKAFHRDLAAWYREAKRDLPWRRTADPYAIAVSEFMLQQTQVATVIPYYQRWLGLFPTWQKLAEAPTEAVVKAWEGLGYYARARNLQRLAQEVAGPLGGVLPLEVAELRKLPGIGPYTAGAIASLALRRRAALLDGNVIRVLARVFAIGEDVGERVTQEKLWGIAEGLLPGAEACADHNSSLMELGALVCTPLKPGCLVCPLRAVCRAPDPEKLPRKAPKVVERLVEEIAVVEKDGRYWCEPGPAKGRLAGFWRLPAFDPEVMEKAASVALADFYYSITKYRVRLTGWRVRFKPGAVPNPAGRWLSRGEMEELTMSSAQRRLRDALPCAGDSNR